MSAAAATDAPATPHSPRVQVEAVTLGYETREVAKDLTLELPQGGFTAIIGPNGCGKSTLLKSMTRIVVPSAGRVLIDGVSVGQYRPRDLAQVVALLPQSPVVPEGISVRDLVSRGRFAHHSLLRQWTAEDAQTIGEAMEQTDVAQFAERAVTALSGGQRQRVWLAMVLAQAAPLLLLDEPTTYLDVATQYQVLEICSRYHAQEGRAVVAVLHDLNQAARYATELVVLEAGKVVAQGPPREVLTQELVAEVFGLASVVIPDPQTGTPLVVPGREPLVGVSGA